MYGDLEYTVSVNNKTSVDYHGLSIKQYWTPFELDTYWTFSRDEIRCVQRKEKRSQLAYALKMKYFDIYGCFPSGDSDVPLAVIDMVTAQLSLNPKKIKPYNKNSRLAQIHNNEIRNYYGFRKINTSDWQKIQTFIESSLWPQDLPLGLIYHEIYRFLKQAKVEPPAHLVLTRQVNVIYTESENNFFQTCSKHINTEIETKLYNLLKSENNEDPPLIFIRKLTGRITHPTITEELQKLEHLNFSLYINFLSTVPKKILKKYHDLVAVSNPYDLLAMNPVKLKAVLICFCHYKGAKILDTLIEFFVKRFHKMQNMAEERAKEDLWQWYKETDKDRLLDEMVDISLDNPEGIIKEKIYEGVGGEERLKQSKVKRKSPQQVCREFEYKHLHSLYVHAYGQDFLPILRMLKLRPTLPSKKALCTTIDAILNNKPLILTDVLTKSVQKYVEGNSLYAEIAVLEVLHDALKCKNVWVQSTLKHADPEKDLPHDFHKKKKTYCKMLNVPEEGSLFVRQLKKMISPAIKGFNADIVTNPDVKIKKKTKKGKTSYRFCLTPYKAQPEPHNIQNLKKEIERLWPNNSLLDILKETDLRIGLTSELITMTDKVTLDRQVLQERLLLCLFAMGTNTEFKRVCANSDHTEADLWYVKKRFITPESLRHILKKLADHTLAIRDKDVWGEELDAFVSDSTKFAVWQGNAMSEYHIRYQGNGVMAYWHIDKKALCISSQLRRCADSEVVAMLTGILHHGTKANIKYHTTDTHGQSLIAFAFTYLLGIELRPRIKGIGHIKLSKPDHNFQKSHYNNIESMMGKAMNWKRVEVNYDQLLRYLVAFKFRTAEPEVLFKRFIVENKNDPIYKAALELGRAVFTIFSCRYLMTKEMQIEIEEMSNAMENWNSGHNFIFHGKRGVISSNDEIDQELSILSLHLLQSSLVYINTLMIQHVLKSKAWRKITLTVEDKRALTALFSFHINQYGIFILNMNKRLNIEEEV